MSPTTPMSDGKRLGLMREELTHWPLEHGEQMPFDKAFSFACYLLCADQDGHVEQADFDAAASNDQVSSDAITLMFQAKAQTLMDKLLATGPNGTS